MIYGIIYTAYGDKKYVTESLSPWIKARKDKLDGNEFQICAVSVPFEKFDKIENSALETLQDHIKIGDIDHVIHGNIPMKETEARGNALKYLIENGAETVIQVDFDEFYVQEQISKIIKFTQSEGLVPCFRLCLKNFVFDDKHYLAEPFAPMRIHRINFGSCKAKSFWDDNNVMYQLEDGSEIKDTQLATMTVPKIISWVVHYSWLSDQRSKSKILYQTSRSWQCSFRWNNEKNILEFNPDFYKRTGQPLPEVIALTQG